MKSTTFTFVLIFIIHHSLFSQDNKRDSEEQDYAVTIKGDTIFGRISSAATTHNSWNGYGYKLITKDGNNFRYNVDEAKVVYFDGVIHEAKPKKPDKGEDSKKDFMEVFMQNTKATIYLYVTPGANGSYYDFYVYVEDKFIVELKKNNHKELLLKYFGNCDAIVEAFKRKDNWYSKLAELRRMYSNFKCK